MSTPNQDGTSQQGSNQSNNKNGQGFDLSKLFSPEVWKFLEPIITGSASIAGTYLLFIRKLEQKVEQLYEMAIESKHRLDSQKETITRHENLIKEQEQLIRQLTERLNEERSSGSRQGPSFRDRWSSKNDGSRNYGGDNNSTHKY